MTELGIETVDKLLQSLKAPTPIEVTESEIVIDVSPLQPENALTPIEVTELGIVIDVNPLQPEKPYAGIC